VRRGDALIARAQRDRLAEFEVVDSRLHDVALREAGRIERMPAVKPAVDPIELASKYRDHVAALSQSYARVLSEAGFDGVVIHSGAPKPRSIFDDQFWPLRPVPHFHHWLPLETARSALYVESGKKPALFWFNVVDFWEQARKPESDHFWASFDVKEVKDPSAIKELLPPGGGSGAKKLAFVGEERPDCALWGLADAAFNPAELVKKLDALRVRKSPYELLCLREANRRASLGHKAVIDNFRAGDFSELDLHLRYLHATGQDDPETPYKNIVALGRHAATLHHVGYSRDRVAAQSLLLDAGAKYLGYDSDITRTAVKGRGAAANAFAQLVTGLEKMQQELCKRAALGRPYEELHDQSHELLAPLLRDVGLAKKGTSDAELVASGVTRRFLPHGLGHSLGLQTHDVGCRNVNPEARNPWLRNTTAITPGQVFTIEPGVYFIDHLLAELRASPAGAAVDWKLADALAPFGGVRIEDDLFVTDAGVDNVTRDYLPEPPAVVPA
jgi:Xaa-Pro dipeptidase